MKRKITNLCAILAVLVGIAAIVYPAIGNYLYQRSQQERIEFYETVVNELPPAEETGMLEACREYNESLLTSMVRIEDPFEVPEPEDDAYAQLLNVAGDGAMAYLEIPAIDCRLTIYHGTDDGALAKGVGHLKGTSLPVGGTGTHAVMSAHTGTRNRKLFTDLDQLEVGDEFYIHVLTDVLAYRVDKIETVLPDDLECLKIDPAEDYVTLVTCTPYGVNSHRLLVRGTRVDYAPQAQQPQQEDAAHGGMSSWLRQYLIAVGMGAVVALGIIAVVLIILAIRKKVNKNRLPAADETPEAENVPPVAAGGETVPAAESKGPEG